MTNTYEHQQLISPVVDSWTRFRFRVLSFFSCKKCIERIPQFMKQRVCANVQSIWIKSEVCSGRNFSPKCTAVSMDRKCGDFKPEKKACASCVNKFYHAGWIAKNQCDPSIQKEYCMLHTTATQKPTPAATQQQSPTPSPAVSSAAAANTKAITAVAALPQIHKWCEKFLEQVCGTHSLLRLLDKQKKSCLECTTKAVPAMMAARYGCEPQDLKDFCNTQKPHEKDCADFMDEDCGHLSPGLCRFTRANSHKFANSMCCGSDRGL